jgi:hypothetical protein
MKITFQFHGGFLDGQTLTGDTDLRICTPARRYVFLSDAGRVGKRFREFPPDRSELIRELLDQQSETIDEMDAVVCQVMGSMDPQNPPSCDQLKKMMDVALREIGADLAVYHRKSQQQNELTNCQLEAIKSEVYEVVSREETKDRILVKVQYLGDDTAATMYDL